MTERPIPWENLKPYEQQQGGYWLYGPDCDVYGNGKQWVSVPHPRPDDEVTPSGQPSAGGTGSTT